MVTGLHVDQQDAKFDGDMDEKKEQNTIGRGAWDVHGLSEKTAPCGAVAWEKQYLNAWCHAFKHFPTPP